LTFNFEFPANILVGMPSFSAGTATPTFAMALAAGNDVFYRLIHKKVDFAARRAGKDAAAPRLTSLSGGDR
jgi:hypothetical protein